MSSPLRYIQARSVRVGSPISCPERGKDVDYIASPAKDLVIAFFEIVDNKYRKITEPITINKLLNEPVIIKVKDVYYAGDSTAWDKLSGKNRKWAHDWVDLRYRKLVDAGLAWQDMREMNISFLEKNLLILKYFPGSKFVKDTSCKNNDSQSIKDSSIGQSSQSKQKLIFGEKEALMKLQLKNSNSKAQSRKMKQSSQIWSKRMG